MAQESTSNPSSNATTDTSTKLDSFSPDSIRFRFEPKEKGPSPEEIARVRALAETTRVIEISYTPRIATNLLHAGKPAEELRAEKIVGNRYVLWVAVNYLRYGIDKYTLVRKEISESDWNAMIDEIAEHNLLEWKPFRAGMQIPIDADLYQMRLSGGENRNRHSWYRPLENGVGAEKLANVMSKIARKRVGFLPLAHFQPERKPAKVAQPPKPVEVVRQVKPVDPSRL